MLRFLSWARCYVLGHRLEADYDTMVVTCRRCSRVIEGFWRSET